MPHHLLEACELLRSSAASDARLESLLSARLDRLESGFDTDSVPVEVPSVALASNFLPPRPTSETHASSKLAAKLNACAVLEQQKPSNLVRRTEALMQCIQANEGRLGALWGGGVHVGMAPIPAYDVVRGDATGPGTNATCLGPVAEGTTRVPQYVSHLSVIRGMRSQVQCPPSSVPLSELGGVEVLPTLTPQQLVDAARPGDVIVLRPGALYMDAPLKVTTPFITIRGGGRRVAPPARRARMGGANRSVEEHYHLISLRNGRGTADGDDDEAEEELVPKTATILHNTSRRAAISIHAEGVRIEHLTIYQVSHEAPAVSVTASPAAGDYIQPVDTSTACMEVPSVIGAKAVVLRDCVITSVNCHAVHAVRSDGGLEVRGCSIRSLRGSGIQIGLSASAGEAAPLDASCSASPSVVPFRVPRVVLRDVAFGYCGISCVVLQDPRCEYFLVDGCTMGGGCGRHGIHFATVPSPPLLAGDASHIGGNSRASSASFARGARAGSPFGIRSSSAKQRASVVALSPAEEELRTLRTRQKGYSLAVKDTLIKDPAVCGIVIDAGRYVAVVERTRVELSLPDSVGLFLHQEATLLRADNNFM